MADLITLSGLRTRIRERADMETDGWVSDAEINRHINSEYKKLLNKLMRAYPSRFHKESSFTVTNAANTLTIPSDLVSVLQIMVDVSDITGLGFTSYVEIEEIPVGAYAKWVQTTDNGYGFFGWRYITISGTEVIQILPAPSGSRSVVMSYLSKPDDLSDDADTLDGVLGYEEYVILKVAIRLLNKEGTSAAGLIQELAVFDDELNSDIENRNMTGAVLAEVDCNV